MMSACMIHDFLIRRTQLMRLAALFLVPLAGISPSLQAQQAGAAELKRENTLGMSFLAVPGTSVLFSQYETTVEQWQAFIKAENYKWDYVPHFEQGPTHPVVGITLQDARRFCSWLTNQERNAGKLSANESYRLPTQVEWDAAIGLKRTRKPDLTVDDKMNDDRAFPWGMDWPPPPKVANFSETSIPDYEDGFPFTAPAGQFRPTPQGLYDLSGNVWEWCWDADVRSDTDGILRGGSWAYFRPECLTAAYRYRSPGDVRMPTIGFRCVYEDKKRTATMLAGAEKQKQDLREAQREQILGGAVAADEMAAMRKKLQGSGGSSSSAPDLSALKPARAGSAFTSTLGLEFTPISSLSEGRVLAGKTEVRVQDFELWLKGTDRTWETKPTFLLGSTHPAAGVTWQDARDFATWLTQRDRAARLLPSGASYRLPTDAEWSALAGLPAESGSTPMERHLKNQEHFPWSDKGQYPPSSLTVNLNAAKMPGYNDNYSYTAPVSAEPANSMGIMGLGGNVAEWCQDEATDPTSSPAHIIRGGSWQTSEREKLLSSARRMLKTERASPDVGFRLMLDLGQ
jgi:formylglycine-generating enzyme required for sulfatase activity